MKFAKGLKSQDKNLNMLRTKRAFGTTENAIFKEISIAKNCLRPESAPLINIQKHDRIA